jgi:hypothetical protein
MQDAGKIIAGAVIFLGLVTSPLWYGMATGKSRYVPDPKIVTQEKQCVEPKQVMRDRHMDIVYSWRDKVVREGKTTYVSSDGRSFEMSLTRTCLRCHTNKAEFCDKCHDYAGVKPYCWDCHVVPKEGVR